MSCNPESERIMALRKRKSGVLYDKYATLGAGSQQVSASSSAAGRDLGEKSVKRRVELNKEEETPGQKQCRFEEDSGCRFQESSMPSSETLKRGEIFTISSKMMSHSALLVGLVAGISICLLAASSSHQQSAPPSTTTTSAPQQQQQRTGHKSSLDVGTKTRPMRRKFHRPSIDRFDVDDEQIRAPLLQAPTTLAPLTGGRQQEHEQRQANSQLATSAASQESTFLSPEEREQFMRNQEAHYEGAQGGADAGSPGGQSDGQLQANQPQQQQAAGSMAYKQQSGPSRPAAAAALQSEASGDGDDDSDYGEPPDSDQPAPEGGPPAPGAMQTNEQMGVAAGEQQQQLGAVGQQMPQLSRREQQQLMSQQVPERRRLAMANSQNLNNQLEMGANGDDDDDPGAQADEQDAYFSRKPAQSRNQQLSQAASYNQNNPEHLRPYQQARQAASEDASESAGAGFGPGPNEAYLAERAGELAGGAGEELDDDQQSDGDSDSAPPAAMADELSEQSQQQPQQPYGGQHQASADSAGNDQAGESSDLRGEARWHGASSPPAPATIPPIPPIPPVSNMEAQRRLRQQAAARDQWEQARLRQNPHLLLQQQQQQQQATQVNNQFTGAGSGANRMGALQYPQATTTQAPYNPQNNPSHAGKYFIN